jgi:hypothetical protein
MLPAVIYVTLCFGATDLRDSTFVMLFGLWCKFIPPSSPSRLVWVTLALHCTVIGLLDFWIFFRTFGWSIWFTLLWLSSSKKFLFAIPFDLSCIMMFSHSSGLPWSSMFACTLSTFLLVFLALPFKLSLLPAVVQVIFFSHESSPFNCMNIAPWAPPPPSCLMRLFHPGGGVHYALRMCRTTLGLSGYSLFPVM